MNKRRDQLLDVSLLSEKDIEMWAANVVGMKAGASQSIVGSDFWELAKTEMVRRQVNAQIRAANALVRWTVVLGIFTGALVAVAVVQLWLRCG